MTDEATSNSLGNHHLINKNEQMTMSRAGSSRFGALSPNLNNEVNSHTGTEHS